MRLSGVELRLVSLIRLLFFGQIESEEMVAEAKAKAKGKMIDTISDLTCYS
jgi:hypothetical protein